MANVKATDLIDYTRASTGTYLDSDGTLKTASTNIPRIEYDAAGNLLGLLIEESRTNLITYSEDFSDSYWDHTNVGSVSRSGVGPDGVADSANLVVSGTGGGTGNTHISENVNVTASSTYTWSIFAKAGTCDSVLLYTRQFTTPANNGYVFNLETGVVTAFSGTPDHTATIQEVGNGWYRCALTFTTDASDLAGTLRFYLANGTDIAVDQDGTDNAYFYGAQFEAGSFPTSYIKTTGSTATRSADVASIDVDQFGYNKSEGSWIIESQVNADVTNTRLAVLTDGNSTSRILSAGYSSFQGFVSDNGATVNITTGSFPVDTPTKLSFGWAENNSAVSLDGSDVVTDLTCTIPTSIDYMTLGSNYTKNPNGSAVLHIKSINYYPKRLSNAKLQELTS